MTLDPLSHPKYYSGPRPLADSGDPLIIGHQDESHFGSRNFTVGKIKGWEGAALTFKWHWLRWWAEAA